MVSVDTGIRALQVVRHAQTVGIDVIVTDHHLPESDLPPALAVLNPNRPDCRYPFKDLCGAGVTLKLVQALLERSELSAEPTRGAARFLSEAGRDCYGGRYRAPEWGKPDGGATRLVRACARSGIMGCVPCFALPASTRAKCLPPTRSPSGSRLESMQPAGCRPRVM